MAELRSIRTEIKIRISPERVFEALITPKDIKGWWGAERAIVIPEPGGIWVASWGKDENDPEYISSAVLKIFDRPKRLLMTDYKYFTKFEPLSFEADFSTEFKIDTLPEGSRLGVIQLGFPADRAADSFYEACREGWITSLNNLKKYLED